MTISDSAGTSRSTVFACTTLIGAPARPPATSISSTSIGSFCGAHERDIRRAAEHDRARHRLVAALLVLEIMLVPAGAADACRHAHDQPVRRLQRGAVGAHVLHAGSGSRVITLVAVNVGALSKPGVEIGYRQPVEAMALALQRLALDHDLMAHRIH